MILFFCGVGACYPFAVYFLAGSGAHLPVMFLTYFMMGLIPLVAAVVPSEAVPEHLKAKAIGLITGVAEVVGACSFLLWRVYFLTLLTPLRSCGLRQVWH